MCYPKPGPRCSAHAQQNLERTRAVYEADTENLEAYEQWREAQEDYDMTPRGMEELQQKADVLAEKAKTDVKTRRIRNELLNRLELMRKVRKERIAAANMDDEGDKPRKHQKLVDEPELQKISDIPTARFPALDGDIFVPTSISQLDTPMMANELDDHGYLVTYDSYECQDQEECERQRSAYYDYCRDKVYGGLQVHEVSARGLMKNAYGLSTNQAQNLPQKLIDRLETLDLKSHIDVESINGYYGEEARIIFSRELQAKLEEIYIFE